MTVRTYDVSGMTCGHCAVAVKTEVGRIPGVFEVDVDLPAGRVTVTGETLDDDKIGAAVAEAGYELKGEAG